MPDELLSMAQRYEAHKQKMQEERANGTYRPRGGGRGRRREEGVYLCMDGVPWSQSGKLKGPVQNTFKVPKTWTTDVVYFTGDFNQPDSAIQSSLKVVLTERQLVHYFFMWLERIKEILFFIVLSLNTCEYNE